MAMSVQILRFFEATRAGCLYRIYVTSVDLLCVKMGRDSIPVPRYSGGGFIAANAEYQNYEEARQAFEREVEEEGQMLDRRGVAGIRIFIKANKRGFQFDADDLHEVRLDYVGKWKRLFFCRPTPAFILDSPADGRLKFCLPAKKDVVIAIHELGRLFGDDLQVNVRLEDYKKALKKYAKIRGA
jgi:hypothetical protein